MAIEDVAQLNLVPGDDEEEREEGVEREKESDQGEGIGRKQPGGCESRGGIEGIRNAEEGVERGHAGDVGGAMKR